MSKSNCFCITTLYDWLKKPVPLFHPIKSKTNRDFLIYVFRRIASAPRIYFESWLVHWISASFVIGQSDYFGFIWRYSLKTASTVLVRCVLQLEKLIEKNYYLHKSAREAYRSYLQAYASHQHKTIFNVSALDLQRVAPAFGFLVPPLVNLSILLIVVLTLLTAFLMFCLVRFGWNSVGFLALASDRVVTGQEMVTEKKKFFKFRDKSVYFILSQGKLIFWRNVRENWNHLTRVI